MQIIDAPASTRILRVNLAGEDPAPIQEGQTMYLLTQQAWDDVLTRLLLADAE